MTISSDDVYLKTFRKVAKSFVEEFLNAKDHVHQLLEGKQRLESGRFREELLRSFLRRILPKSVSVDTGFIYGFEKMENSRQLDIIIWHKDAHSAVYDAGQFVIVPPESVIAVISVKSTMTLSELKGSLENIMSVVPLDYAYRSTYINKRTGQPLPPISKFIIFYSQPKSLRSILPRIQEYYADFMTQKTEILHPLVEALKKIDPFKGDDPNYIETRRAYPRLITTIEAGKANYVQGWGPPDDIYARNTYGPGMKRLPWMYRHDTKITTALEKFVFLLLSSVAIWLETPAISIISAWGDINPLTGIRIGDVEEIINDEGVPLLDVSRINL